MMGVSTPTLPLAWDWEGDWEGDVALEVLTSRDMLLENALRKGE